MADSKEAVAIRPTEKVADDEAIVQDWTVEEERAVLRKIDMRVVPMCLILYLFSFLDRVNIGNARVIGLNRTGLGNMERDLGMSGNDYNIAVSVFYITYCLFEPFSNVILNRSSPSVWISRIAFTWGICATALGGVQNLAGLLAVRLLLGLCEAGLVPGISYYCSFWYRREELASRIALWFGGAGLATAFSSLLAYAIQIGLEGKLGLTSWRWVFIIEGVPTIFIGVLVYFVLPDEPLTAKFMTDRERHIAVNRLKLNAATRGEKHFEKSEIFKVLANPIVWVFALSNFLSITPGYAYSLFLPTIIVGLGKSGLDANLFSAPPFVLSAIATIIGAFLSDRFKTRSYFIILGSALSLAGFAALSVVRDPNQAYGLLFLASLGGVAFPVGWAWLSNNIASHTGRALALGLVLGIGNIGGGISGQIYRTEDRPWYGKGHTALAAFSAVNIVLVLALRAYMVHLNNTKDERIAKKEASGVVVTREEAEFVYQL